jgi:hypothetical protein
MPSMLAPDERALLVDALRPPPDFRVDAAIGTTYSLDLDALLVVPLTFALFDHDDGTLGDPVALLVAIREQARRISLFVQSGEIAAPRQFRNLLAYLEGGVHGVREPRPGRLFHPKLWLLRFTRGEEVRHRVVIATRNLSLSTSWDTVLVADSGDGVPNGGGLVPLLKALPKLATRPLPPESRDRVELMAAEVAGIHFVPPDPAERLEFHTLGVAGGASPEAILATRTDRRLVVSPFLTQALVRRLAGKGTGHILIARPEAFERVGAGATAGFETYVLDDSACGDEDAPAVLESIPPLRGLHAKLYVADAGWSARILTGSANATDAGWGGNVEILAELEGPKSRLGIDEILGERAGQRGLRSLLVSCDPPTEPTEPTVAERLERELDEAVRALAGAGGTTTVVPDAERYLLWVDLPAGPPAGTSAKGRPLSLGGVHERDLVESDGFVRLEFPGVSFEAITPFLVVEVTVTIEKRSASRRVVLDTTLVDAPDDRVERLLTVQLSSAADVLRYLLVLLAIGEPDPSTALQALGQAQGSAGWAADDLEKPLLESMLRALERDPEHLRPVRRLLEDLARTAEGRERLPVGLLEVWEPICEALDS